MYYLHKIFIYNKLQSINSLFILLKYLTDIYEIIFKKCILGDFKLLDWLPTEKLFQKVFSELNGNQCIL